MTHTQGTSGWAPTRDGRELHYVELPGPPGVGAPAVVFESGMAASRSYWGLVQPAVGRWARAVAYDRAGLGRSAPDPQPRTLARLAGDLADLLDHLGPGPFVLVGHSGGGPIVRVAAAARPERIAGLVLVDVTDEACDLLFEPSFRRMEKVAQAGSSALARLGLLRLAYRGQIARFPADVQADLRAEGYTVAAMRTRGAELKGLVAGMEHLRDHPLDAPDLGDLPVTVISGTRPGDGMPARVRAAANASHAYRASRSAGGRHVLAANSAHLVPLTDPELIVEEIRRLVDGA